MRLLARTFTLTLLGFAAGVAHSWIAPIQLGPRENTKKTVLTVPKDNTGLTTDPVETTGNDIAPETSDPAEVMLGLEITIEQAKALAEQFGAPFVDARSAADYAEGHVMGAFHISPDSFAGGVPASMDQLMGYEQTPVVIYCIGGDCHDSHTLAGFLQDLGFEAVHIMSDGYETWARTYPDEVARGNDPFGQDGNP